MALTSAGGYTLETNSSGEPSKIAMLGLYESDYLEPTLPISPITLESCYVLPFPRDGFINSVGVYCIVTESRSVGDGAVVTTEVYVAPSGSTTYTATGAAVSLSLPSSVTLNSVMSTAQPIDPPVAVNAGDTFAVLVSFSNDGSSGSSSFTSCMNATIAIT